MNCCICGAVRNCEKYLDNVFENMEKIGSIFHDYKIVLFYDNSTDNTLTKINEYNSKNNKLIFYINDKPLLPCRTHRLANARNWCLKYVMDNLNTYPYFIMMDCDNVCSTPIQLNILRKYLYQDSWDALSFNREDYYDLWALSISPYLISCRHFKNNFESELKQFIKKLLNNLSENGLLDCYSAFNGFAIYKTSKFINCHYDGRLRIDLISKPQLIQNLKTIKQPIHIFPYGTERSVLEDCEHRSFHLMAINKNDAKIQISKDILF